MSDILCWQLDELNQNINTLEARQEEGKREMVPVPDEVDSPDSDTASFINGLSPEDKEALMVSVCIIQVTVIRKETRGHKSMESLSKY